MPKEVKQLMEIFHAGIYKFYADDGTAITVEFTNDDVKQIAENYNTEIFEANLHIGHDHSEPEQPALAWLGGLEASNGKLFCWFSHISKRAFEISKEKEYKKCSIELGKIEGMKGKYLTGLGFTNYPKVEDLPPFVFSANSIFKAPERFLIDAIDFSNSNNLTDIKMKISENVLNFAARINLNVTDFNSDKEVLDAAAEELAKLQASFANDPSVVGSLSMYIDKFSKMPAEINTLNEKITNYSKEVNEGMITLAIAEGKILPSQKELFSSLVTTLKPDELKQKISGLTVIEMFKKDVIPTGGNEPAAADPNVLNDPKFKNTDGSALTFDQYMTKFSSRKPEDRKFIANFTTDEVAKLPGYKEAK